MMLPSVSYSSQYEGHEMTIHQRCRQPNERLSSPTLEVDRRAAIFSLTCWQEVHRLAQSDLASTELAAQVRKSSIAVSLLWLLSV